MKIVAIDFETANYSDASICAAGLALFVDGVLEESLYWLVRPPKGHGWFREDFTEIHGLTWFDVQDAPEFSAIAPKFLDHLCSADLVVAHNAGFDLRMLRGTLSPLRVGPPYIQLRLHPAPVSAGMAWFIQPYVGCGSHAHRAPV